MYDVIWSKGEPLCRSVADEKIAVVDVGSTSFKILIAERDATGKVHPLHEEKRQVQLLSGQAFSTIAPDAMDRALEAIAHFSMMAAQHNVPLHAIATAGLRDASNGADLIQAAHERVRRCCHLPRQLSKRAGQNGLVCLTRPWCLQRPLVS